MNELKARPLKGGRMRRATGENAQTSRIMLGLLEAVEQERVQSQRHLASELGIALGLANAYLKRCMKKGLVKVRQAPARRYAYYLTPQGFAEKSRLTVEYLSSSFSFFRQAKTDCSRVFELAKTNGVRTVVLVGRSDLAEIASLCAMEQGIAVAGLVEAETEAKEFIGAPVFESVAAIDVPFDAALISDLKKPRAICEEAIERLGIERVLVPDLLRVRIRQQGGVAE